MFSIRGLVYLFLIGVCLLFLSDVKCVDPFESIPVRANCFRKEHDPSGGDTSTLLTTSTNDTWAFLFTQDNPEYPEFLHENDFKLSETSHFKVNCPIEIFIHGFAFGMCTLASYREMKDQLLIRGSYNVILIDWTWGNQGDLYAAYKNIHIVAAQVATLIKNIMNQRGVSKKCFHVIGHSLGAPLAGLIGNYVKIGRITGLDPSGAGFRESRPLNERLDASDADLVDVIHTNMGSCLPYIGNDYQTGHADFIVNDGVFQKSCYLDMIYALLKGDLFYGATSLIPTICSHFEALQYYKVSINPGNCQFIGIDCKDYKAFKSGQCKSCKDSSCAVMGMDFDKYITKDLRNAFPVTLYVGTDILCPYCNNTGLDLYGFANSPPRDNPRCSCS